MKLKTMALSPQHSSIVYRFPVKGKAPGIPASSILAVERPSLGRETADTSDTLSSWVQWSCHAK